MRAQFSPEDIALWDSRKWRVNANGYLTAKLNGRQVLFHRVVVGAATGQLVDHVNHDKLDNRRPNLRIVTRAQNGQNRARARSDSSTGIRGVYPNRGKFTVQFAANNRVFYLGRFATVQEASAVAAAWLTTNAPTGIYEGL